MSEMDNELKEKWVADLRANGHLQTKGVLCHGELGKEQFCCLGRLCEISGAVRSFTKTGWLYEDIEELPHALLSQAQRDHLIDMNDGTINSDPCSFATIADYIERNI